MSEIKEAIERWHRVSETRARFGACDTEPREQFGLMLQRLYDGEDPKIPAGPRAWALFDDMPGARAAAKELRQAAAKVVELALADPESLKEAYVYYYGER